jgi:hypothetical protein
MMMNGERTKQIETELIEQNRKWKSKRKAKQRCRADDDSVNTPFD